MVRQDQQQQQPNWYTGIPRETSVRHTRTTGTTCTLYVRHTAIVGTPYGSPFWQLHLAPSRLCFILFVNLVFTNAEID
jgi:hypothetical protein